MSGERLRSGSLPALRPDVAARWHPELNGDLRPEDVTPGSQRRAYWTCPASQKHVWDAIIAARVKSPTPNGCPFCSGRRVLPEDSFAALNPDLAATLHPDLNKDLRPDAVAPQSNRPAWWVCPENPRHVWSAPIAARRNGSGCPFCRGLKVLPEESLAALRPDAAADWHPTMNEDLRPDAVSPQSNREVWWRCAAGPGHVWRAAVYDRVRSTRNGCPFCAGKIVLPETSLAAMHPDVAARWHPTKYGGLRPEAVRPRPHKVAWWVCPKNSQHEWPAAVANMVASATAGCPFCRGLKVLPEESLAGRFPGIAAQWHPTKNTPLQPTDVSSGSSKKVWWSCPIDPKHVWDAEVSARTGKNKTGCPDCRFQSSRNELRVLAEFSRLFPGTEHRRLVDGHEADVFVPEYGLAVEYDGQFFLGGEDGIRRDRRKRLDLERNGLLLFRLRERPLALLSERDIPVSGRPLAFSEMARLLARVSEEVPLRGDHRQALSRYLEDGVFVAEPEYLGHVDRLPKPATGRSLAEKVPEIAAEWHPTRNGSLTPEGTFYASNSKVWWRCAAGPSHEWEAPPAQRTTGRRTGCPKCGAVQNVAGRRAWLAGERQKWAAYAKEVVAPIFARMSGEGATQKEIAAELNRLGIPTQRNKPWTLARVQAVSRQVEGIFGVELPLST